MARYQDTNSEGDILKAAEYEFINKGYAGARMMEIAKRAGVSHAMLHYYFHSKEELFMQVGKVQERLDKAAANGETCHANALTLFMDIFSLNMSSVILFPAAMAIAKCASLVHACLWELSLLVALAVMSAVFILIAVKTHHKQH